MVRVASDEASAVFVGADSVWTASAPGMVLLTPTSIAHSGTSASIGANGQVTFTAVTSLSLNGVFSASYDNYVIAFGPLSQTVDANTSVRLRASGTDNSTANSYTYQTLNAVNTAISASRSTTNAGILATQGSTLRNGTVVYLYGPYLAQPTSVRTVSGSSYLNASITDLVFTHNQSTAYDGITLWPASGNMSGTLTVMGVRS